MYVWNVPKNIFQVEKMKGGLKLGIKKKVTEAMILGEFWDSGEVKSRISWAEYHNYDTVTSLNPSKHMQYV